MILYEDAQLVVCCKPRGVLSAADSSGQESMAALLAPRAVFPVHRLDRDVPGVMVFAKTKEAASDMSRQVQMKEADKFYYAVTDGVPVEKTGSLEDYLLRDGRTNTSKVVKEGTAGTAKNDTVYNDQRNIHTKCLRKAWEICLHQKLYDRNK